MSWILLTILAISSRATYSIATKIVSGRAKVNAMTQAVLLTGCATVLTLLISPLLGGISTRGLAELWLVVSLMVLSQAFGNILFFKGLMTLEASIAQIAFSSILLWSVILSVGLLGSSFTLKQSIGIALLFIAILMVQYRKGVRRIEPAVLYIVASALLFAVFQVTSAELAKTIPAATYLLLAYGGSTLIIWLAFRKRVNKDLAELNFQRASILRATLFAAITSLGYFGFSYFAYKYAPDRGVVVLLLTTQVVLSVILGIFFLKERSQVGRKIAAGVLAVVSGILIKS